MNESEANHQSFILPNFVANVIDSQAAPGGTCLHIVDTEYNA